MCNIKKLGSVTLLYRELGIFKLTDINKYLIGRFMFRFCTGHVPVLFNSFFAYNTVQGQHNIFIFLPLRLTWVKLESDTEEL